MKRNEDTPELPAEDEVQDAIWGDESPAVVPETDA